MTSEHKTLFLDTWNFLTRITIAENVKPTPSANPMTRPVDFQMKGNQTHHRHKTHTNIHHSPLCVSCQ